MLFNRFYRFTVFRDMFFEKLFPVKFWFGFLNRRGLNRRDRVRQKILVVRKFFSDFIFKFNFWITTIEDISKLFNNLFNLFFSEFRTNPENKTRNFGHKLLPSFLWRVFNNFTERGGSKQIKSFIDIKFKSNVSTILTLPMGIRR